MVCVHVGVGPCWCVSMLVCVHISVCSCWCVSTLVCVHVGVFTMVCVHVGVFTLVCVHIGVCPCWCVSMFVTAMWWRILFHNVFVAAKIFCHVTVCSLQQISPFFCCCICCATNIMSLSLMCALGVISLYCSIYCMLEYFWQENVWTCYEWFFMLVGHYLHVTSLFTFDFFIYFWLLYLLLTSLLYLTSFFIFDFFIYIWFLYFFMLLHLSYAWINFGGKMCGPAMNGLLCLLVTIYMWLLYLLLTSLFLYVAPSIALYVGMRQASRWSASRRLASKIAVAPYVG